MSRVARSLKARQFSTEKRRSMCVRLEGSVRLGEEGRNPPDSPVCERGWRARRHATTRASERWRFGWCRAILATAALRPPPSALSPRPSALPPFACRSALRRATHPPIDGTMPVCPYEIREARPSTRTERRAGALTENRSPSPRRLAQEPPGPCAPTGSRPKRASQPR